MTSRRKVELDPQKKEIKLNRNYNQHIMLISQCSCKKVYSIKTVTYDSHEKKNAETNIFPTYREM